MAPIETVELLYAGDRDVHVPSVVADRSSRRVLTTELVDAMRFAEFVASAPQAAKDHAGEVIFRTCMSSLFRHGVYNGDPHPGNYLFHLDGRVALLDFGCVRRFDANRYWTQVIVRDGSGRGRIMLRSHGKEIEFGAFLSEPARMDAARKLRDQLRVER